MTNVPLFHVEEVTIPDPAIWPTDWTKTVTRYALVDERGVVYLGGDQFGFVKTMRAADHSSYDCRALFRKTRIEAWLDQIRWPIIPSDPTCDAEWNCFAAFNWAEIDDLIQECGEERMIEAFFEHSGSSVVHDFTPTDAWIELALAKFGEALREPARRWYEHTEPKHMPTSYLSDDETNRRRKAEWYGNIKMTARLVLERLGEQI